MSIKYYYKAQNTDLWIDITNCITEHASGDQEINNTSLNFKFKLYPINSEIDPNIGDDILIVENNENIIACGYIFDNGRELIGFDKDLSQAICKFNITCLERDFSSYPIDNLSFTQTNLSVILDEFMLYTDDSISYNSQKYQVKFSDVEIDALTVEKKTVREALTDLCDQIDSFWIMKYILETDETNIWNVYRYIEIYDKNGLTLDSSSIWYEGIQNKHLKGTITNPITANIDRIPTVPDIKSVDIKSDPSVIINYLELACKIYASGNDTDLERRNIPAVLGQSDYDLFDYASDIIYVAFGINTNILSSATNVIIPIPSKDAVTIEAGNIARFPDNDPDNFYEVITVTKVNTTKTNIYFDPPLAFTPAVGQSFEIVSNVPIYRSEKEVDYSDRGVLIDTAKTSTAKLKFLDLSEPPPGINIIVYYKKIKNFAFKVINDESKGIYGLKYKQFTIDDDIVLTQDELNNLSSKLLILNPVYKFTVELYRYGLPIIGMAVSVNIDGYITENFILNSMEWQIIGNDDPNEMPIIEKTLDFSTYIGDPQRVIDRFVRSKRKATAISGELDQIRKQVERIKVIENVTWSLNAPNTLSTPVALDAEDINIDGFKANYEPVSGAVTHKLDVSIYEDFRACVSGYNNKNILRSGYWVVNGLHEITSTDIFYYRFRARSSDGITSLNSNVITVNREVNNDLQKDSYTTLALNFPNNYNDGSGNGNNATGINSPSFTTALLTGDSYSLELDGINQVIELPNAISTSRDISIRAIFKYLSFARDYTYLYSEWGANDIATNYQAKIIVAYDKTNKRIEVLLYDESYNEYNTSQYVLLHSVEIDFNLISSNLTQISWNNTSKEFLLCLNNISISTLQVGGGISIASLNLNDSIATKIIYWGGFTYPTSLDASLSPNMILARLYVDNGIARDLTYHQQDWSNISSRL